jgi:hypothetical protein
VYSGEGADGDDGEGDEVEEDAEVATARQLAMSLVRRSEAEAVRKILDSIDDARRCISFQSSALCTRLDEWAVRTVFFQREVQAMGFALGKAQDLIPRSYKRRKIK